jgi:hypothetical protein
MITIYQARKIVTMNPSRPLASHVAVRDTSEALAKAA